MADPVNARLTNCRQVCDEIGNKYGLPSGFLWSMAQQESGCKNSPRNFAGAIGILQIVPGYHPSHKPGISMVADLEYGARTMAGYYRQIKSLALTAGGWHAGLARLLKLAPCLPPRTAQFYDGLIYTADYCIQVLTRAGLQVDAVDCGGGGKPPKQTQPQIDPPNEGSERGEIVGDSSTLRRYLIIGSLLLLLVVGLNMMSKR